MLERLDKRSVADRIENVRLTNLFLAVMLSFGLFTELQIGAFPKFDSSGTSFTWYMFICKMGPSTPVPDNWKCRAISFEASSLWAELWGCRYKDFAAPNFSDNDWDIKIAWRISLQKRDCNAFASYNAIIYFAICLMIIGMCENPLIPMLGSFASILTSAPGSLTPFILPWDLPTMAAWSLVFWGYLKLKSSPDLRHEWVSFAFVIALLGLLKETVLVTAFFFLGAPWRWPKRLIAIVGIVVASQCLSWLLFEAKPGWMCSSSNGGIEAAKWHPLMLWPLLLANAGSVAMLPWLLWKKKDLPLASVCAAFAVLQALNNLSWGVYSENRDWLELAPIGWTLIGEMGFIKNRL